MGLLAGSVLGGLSWGQGCWFSAAWNVASSLGLAQPLSPFAGLFLQAPSGPPSCALGRSPAPPLSSSGNACWCILSMGQPGWAPRPRCLCPTGPRRPKEDLGLRWRVVDFPPSPDPTLLWIPSRKHLFLCGVSGDSRWRELRDLLVQVLHSQWGKQPRVIQA